MPRDFINNLPTELLRHVFDYLLREDREKAAAVCTRWSDIISSGRYDDKLELKSHHLAKGDIDALMHFRSISTEYYDGQHRDSLCKLQQFMNKEVVMKNVVELYLAFGKFYWKDLFSPEKELHFPELQRITFSGLRDSDVMDISRCKISSPRLKVLHLISSPSMWLLSDQIETLVIEYSAAIVFNDADLFPNLRSLTLTKIDQLTINDSFKSIFRRLRELRILYVRELNYREILENIHDIESLSIYSAQAMSAEEYALINNMTKLKQLCLILAIDETSRGLSLPCLEKLTIPPFGWPPLENVPNLRSLCIESKYLIKVYVTREKMAAYFRSFGHRLHHLTLSKVHLEEDFVSQICLFNNLHTLKMFQVKVEYDALEKILQHIGKLRLFRLQSCTLVKNLIFWDNNSDCTCELCYGQVDFYDPDPWQKSVEPCFSKLMSQYVHCAFVTDSNQFLNLAFPDPIDDNEMDDDEFDD